MDKEKLIPWIEKLNKAGEKDRDAIVAAFAKENNLKPGEAWKLFLGAGFDPKADPQANQNPDTGKKHTVVLRHKTEYSKYRRAGLVLTQKAETYEVTEKQLDALKKDPWVVIGAEAKDGAGK